jgi:hypothetical protein
MDVSGFLTLFAVIAAIITLLPEDKKFELLLNLKSKITRCILWGFCALFVYLLFYDVFFSWGIIISLNWAKGFDKESTLLLISIIFLGYIFKLIFAKSIKENQVPHLIYTISNDIKYEQKMTLIDSLLNRNLYVLKRYLVKVTLFQLLIERLLNQAISKKINVPLISLTNEEPDQELLCLRDAFRYHFFILPLTKLDESSKLKSRQRKLIEILKKDFFTSRVKAHILKTNPKVAFELISITESNFSEEDIEVLVSSSHFRHELDTFFEEYYFYESILEFSPLLDESIGDAGFIDKYKFFDRLESIVKGYVFNNKMQLFEAHEYIPNDSFIKQTPLNFYIDCVFHSSVEVSKKEQSFSSRHPSWVLTKTVEQLIELTNENAAVIHKNCEFESRAGYFIFNILNRQIKVFEHILESKSTQSYDNILESMGHSFYKIFKNSNSEVIKIFSFELLARVFFKSEQNVQILESSIYGIYGNGIKSCLLDFSILKPFTVQSGKDINWDTLSKNLVSYYSENECL